MKNRLAESAGGSLHASPDLRFPLIPWVQSQIPSRFFSITGAVRTNREGCADQFALAAAHQGGGSTAEEGLTPAT